MILLQILLSISLAAVSGILVVSLISPDDEPGASTIFIRIWLGLGAGFGVVSINFFLWRLFTDPNTRFFLLGELALVVILLAAGFRAGKVTVDPVKLAKILKPGKLTLLGTFFWTITALSVLIHLLIFFKIPQGGWDAWMIWNLHARFLVRGGEFWMNVFSPLLPHPDYPMLVSANVARVWTILNNESVYAPAAIGGAFTFGTLGLLVSTVTYLRGRNLGYLSGLIFLGATVFHVHGPTQSSDFPLAYFMLGTFVLLFLFEQNRAGGNRYLVIAGLFSGMAAWTKNEGFLFILAVALARVAAVGFRRDGIELRNEAKLYLTGLAPILTAILVYKSVFSPANDLIEAQGPETLARLTDWPRYLIIGKEFLFQTVRLDARFSIPFAGLLLLGILFGTPRFSQWQTGVVTILTTVWLTLGGYFIVFVLTFFEVEWHLYTANVRLFWHIWPIAVLAISAIIPPTILSNKEEDGSWQA